MVDMDTSQNLPTMMPSASSQPKRNSLAITYIVSGIALIIIIGVYFFYHSSYGALQGIRFLSGPFDTRSLQELGIRGSHTVAFSGSGRIIDYAHVGSTMVAIKVDESGRQDVYSLGKNPNALTNDGHTKSGVSVSSDGSMVAYAMRASESVATSTKDFYAIGSWRIQLLNSIDKTVKDLGTGFAPQFFESGGVSYLAYLTNSSLRIVNTATFATQDIPFNFGVQHSYLTMAISPDGKFAVLPDVGNNYRLYSLNENSGLFRIMPGSALPEGTALAAFKGNTIVSASYNTNNSLIRISTIEQPDLIRYARTIPRTLVFKLIP